MDNMDQEPAKCIKPSELYNKIISRIDDSELSDVGVQVVSNQKLKDKNFDTDTHVLLNEFDGRAFYITGSGNDESPFEPLEGSSMEHITEIGRTIGMLSIHISTCVYKYTYEENGRYVTMINTYVDGRLEESIEDVFDL